LQHQLGRHVHHRQELGEESTATVSAVPVAGDQPEEKLLVVSERAIEAGGQKAGEVKNPGKTSR
jgi:hypothetical protein